MREWCVSVNVSLYGSIIVTHAHWPVGWTIFFVRVVIVWERPTFSVSFDVRNMGICGVFVCKNDCFRLKFTTGDWSITQAFENTIIDSTDVWRRLLVGSVCFLGNKPCDLVEDFRETLHWDHSLCHQWNFYESNRSSKQQVLITGISLKSRLHFLSELQRYLNDLIIGWSSPSKNHWWSRSRNQHWTMESNRAKNQCSSRSDVRPLIWRQLKPFLSEY